VGSVGGVGSVGDLDIINPKAKISELPSPNSHLP
jgi:hypothetical protein